MRTILHHSASPRAISFAGDCGRQRVKDIHQMLCFFRVLSTWPSVGTHSFAANMTNCISNILSQTYVCADASPASLRTQSSSVMAKHTACRTV